MPFTAHRPDPTPMSENPRVCVNQHESLARQLQAEGISFFARPPTPSCNVLTPNASNSLLMASPRLTWRSPSKAGFVSWCPLCQR